MTNADEPTEVRRLNTTNEEEVRDGTDPHTTDVSEDIDFDMIRNDEEQDQR